MSERTPRGITSLGRDVRKAIRSIEKRGKVAKTIVFPPYSQPVAYAANEAPATEVELTIPAGPSVYVLHAPPLAAVKIGFVKSGLSIFQRIAALKTGCPSELIPLAIVRGSLDQERRAHELFRSDRLAGEWFRLSPRITLFIEELQDSGRIGAAFWRVSIG